MRELPWLWVYVVAGLAMVARWFTQAYANAVDICDMYPHFRFGETLQEELWLHHTTLPVVNVAVSTISLFGYYALAYVLIVYRICEIMLVAFTEFMAGRWLLEIFTVHLPYYLPFLFAEPSVPPLLSDSEELDGIDNDAPPLNATEYKQAMEKLVQVKNQHAHCNITRGDDWLVFDPLHGLVRQKTLQEQQQQQQNEAQDQKGQESSAVTESEGPVVHELRKEEDAHTPVSSPVAAVR